MELNIRECGHGSAVDCDAEISTNEVITYWWVEVLCASYAQIMHMYDFINHTLMPKGTCRFFYYQLALTKHRGEVEVDCNGIAKTLQCQLQCEVERGEMVAMMLPEL